MVSPTMMNSMPLLVLALSTALAAPAAVYDDYVEQVPQKRAALVLDRLLVALQKALHEEEATSFEDTERNGPRTAPLRLADEDIAELVSLQSSLERRGQTNPSRGRVLRCYFNAVTCF